MGRTPKITKATRVMFITPDAEQLKALFTEWRQGGVSLWDLKRKHHVKAKAMLPAFKKVATKEEARLLSRGPAAKVPVGKLEKAEKVVAPKKAKKAESETPAQLKRRAA